MYKDKGRAFGSLPLIFGPKNRKEPSVLQPCHRALTRGDVVASDGD